ncbi:MAG: hypothetical protein E7375_03390 [Clostridiales bacterium]|nr:hypothetical protein [Clostridiales bacterium]
MKNVLLIDSGSGGVNILAESVRVAPYCNFLLFCDDKNMPYGNKSKEVLIETTLNNLEMIKTFFDFEIVVMACNTLTSTCLEVCREKYSYVEFIGTVPAIKPALKQFDKNDVLVLATQNTLENSVIIRKNKGIKTLALPWLANEIDANLDNVEVFRNRLAEELLGTNVKAVVLGCTHYSSISAMLEQILGKGLKIYDSANGVARRLLSFVQSETINYKVQIMVSQNYNLLPMFWNHFYNKVNS